MSVVKNFGFGHPFIKSTAASRSHDRPAGRPDPRTYNEQNGDGFWSSRFSSVAASGRNKMSLREYEAWCQRQRDALNDAPEGQDANGVNGAQGAHSRYRSFMAAREFARSLGLGSGSDWRRYAEGHLSHLGDCPPDIPATPQRTYRNDGWVGYADWLGLEES